MSARLILAALLALPALSPATAREQIPAEERVFNYNAARVPSCDNPAVLDRLASRFRQTEAEYWSSSLEITGFSRIQTTSFRPNGLDFIPRRYCRGVVTLNNRRTSPVYYVVTQDGGMAGHDFGLQFCVMGYDRQWASAPECKMARQ